MTLALIAGRGRLPVLLAKAQETPPLVCVYEGTVPDDITCDLTFRIETLGSLLVTLGQRGVTEVCFAGGLDRPVLDLSKIDDETAPLIPLFQDALQKGDDGAFKVVFDIFQQTGFTVRGAHELVPELLAKGGVYGDAWPDAEMRSDAETGAAHLASIGPKDIGQACIVINGKIIATEDARGTDSLIKRLAPLPKDKRPILFKAPKPQQTRLIDLPTIGPETIDAAGHAGFAGVVIDAGDVLVLDMDRCVALANHHSLVLWARTGE